MKLSLLDMTQNILSSLDSDEVNGIGDTVESRQVAEVIKTVYFNIVTRANLPEHNQLFTLTPSGELDQPVLMLRPDIVSRIEWIKYNIQDEDDTSDSFSYVTILPVQQFMDMTYSWNSDEDYVESFILNDITFRYRNDQHPTYCTVLKDYFVVFDAYDNKVDGTLQESKTQCYGRVVPEFRMENNFIPDLDTLQFPLLLNEAKSLAFIELKQVPHEKAEQESRRQWTSLQKSKHFPKQNDFDRLPNFGRK